MKPITLKTAAAICLFSCLASIARAELPNILFCISDDQSYWHTGANGDQVIRTPAFDRVAREGIRFTHAFCDAPTCGPSRSAILTGQHIWRLEEAGNIHSTLPAHFATYPDMLKEQGYVTGFTGKGWSPGRLEVGGRTENPAGTEHSRNRLQTTQPGISNKDYASNFSDFLDQCPENTPFCFWLGTHEPHRHYQQGAGLAAGKDPSKVVVPQSLPDTPLVRSDILDYYTEVEHFDQMVERALNRLEQEGELDNTIVVVTSDHGMPFPRAKASLYDTGTQVPLAIRWGNGIQNRGRVSNAFVNLSDLAPTFIEVAGLAPPAEMTGRSILDILQNQTSKLQPARDHALIAMERHDGCRKGGKGYPCRAIRTSKFLFILNHEPSRWPSGSPDASVCARAIPYGEIDTSPTKTLMMKATTNEQLQQLQQLAFGLRPAEELYDLTSDPWQLKNVAGDPKYSADLDRLRTRLTRRLKQTNDPRQTGGAVLWDYYPYYGVRKNRDWKVDPMPSESVKQ
ncbi:MAG: sulfatase [Planctomycetaceae bacterium]|nr:sulfatase [Planctomycetaceae bacterium]